MKRQTRESRESFPSCCSDGCMAVQGGPPMLQYGMERWKQREVNCAVIFLMQTAKENVFPNNSIRI